jgi:uncharacterized damage-inducible protein DinB
MISDMERETVLQHLAGTSSALLATLDKFSDADFVRCPGEGCWSAAQNLEHIAFVEGRVLRRIQAAIETPADPTRQSAMHGRDEELFEGARSRSARVRAPTILHPTGKASREELVRAFHEARARSVQFASQTEADLRSHFAVHPVFGELDCYQWLMLIPSHCERHRAQMAEVLEGC